PRQRRDAGIDAGGTQGGGPTGAVRALRARPYPVRDPGPIPALTAVGGRNLPTHVVQRMGTTRQWVKTKPILVVDDDIDHRIACRELLEEHGFSVQEVGDGKKALARLVDPAEAQPGLVLLDLSMPLM